MIAITTLATITTTKEEEQAGRCWHSARRRFVFLVHEECFARGVPLPRDRHDVCEDDFMSDKTPEEHPSAKDHGTSHVLRKEGLGGAVGTSVGGVTGAAAGAAIGA